MQILLIILVGSLFLFDESPNPDWLLNLQPDWPLWIRAGVIAMGFIAALSVLFMIQTNARHRIEQHGQWKSIIISERASSITVAAIVFIHVINIALFGWLQIVRGIVGNLILIDDIIALLPALLAITIVWAMQYPVHRLIREATLIRKLDLGEPVYPIPNRGQFVLAQVRLHFVLILLPILLVIGWREVIVKVADSHLFISEYVATDSAQLIAMGLGTACIFLLAPVMIRHLWDTHPLPTGELRTRLLKMCKLHHIRIRELLVWNTTGSMINGAVMGLIGRFRFVLLTDALLDSLTPIQVEAVMAHELGHIRKKHLPALIISILAILTLTSVTITTTFQLFQNNNIIATTTQTQQNQNWQQIQNWYAQLTNKKSINELSHADATSPINPDSSPWPDTIIFTGSLLLTLILFGWISRRFERQADTFAVKHLSKAETINENDQSNTKNRMTPQACATMINTLALVADLNHISPTRKSWRHGSIAWRQKYLNSLIGKNRNRLPIDRQISIINLLAIMIIAFSFSYYLWSQ